MVLDRQELFPTARRYELYFVEDSSLWTARLSGLISNLPDVDLIATVETEADAISQIANCVPHVLILDLHLRSGSGLGYCVLTLATVSGGRRSAC